jgi:hypothetical protein
MEEKLKKEIKLTLGAPLREIELIDEHYEVALSDANESYMLYNPGKKDVPKDIWIKKYALANCKEILGRIRGKFGGVVGPEDNQRIMDHKSLISESKNEKHELISLISNY